MRNTTHVRSPPVILEVWQDLRSLQALQSGREHSSEQQESNPPSKLLVLDGKMMCLWKPVPFSTYLRLGAHTCGQKRKHNHVCCRLRVCRGDVDGQFSECSCLDGGGHASTSASTHPQGRERFEMPLARDNKRKPAIMHCDPRKVHLQQ